VERILYHRYRPRRATAEEARRYFLQNHCDAPVELFGTAMEKEAVLDAETLRWRNEAKGRRRPVVA